MKNNKHFYFQVFPQSKHKTCFFHLSQAIEKKMKELGLVGIISSSLEYQIQLKMIRSLAYVPLDFIEDTFRLMKENFPIQFQPLLSYFDKNYVSGEIKTTSTGREYIVKPRYSPKLWNIHEQFINNHQSTTNRAESWHRRMKSIVATKSGNVNVLISHLKKEASCVTNNMACIQSGRVSSRQKKNSPRECILRVLNNREDYASLYVFLKHIAKNI